MLRFSSIFLMDQQCRYINDDIIVKFILGEHYISIILRVSSHVIQPRIVGACTQRGVHSIIIFLCFCLGGVAEGFPEYVRDD